MTKEELKAEKINYNNVWYNEFYGLCPKGEENEINH